MRISIGSTVPNVGGLTLGTWEVERSCVLHPETNGRFQIVRGSSFAVPPNTRTAVQINVDGARWRNIGLQSMQELGYLYTLLPDSWLRFVREGHPDLYVLPEEMGGLTCFSRASLETPFPEASADAVKPVFKTIPVVEISWKGMNDVSCLKVKGYKRDSDTILIFPHTIYLYSGYKGEIEHYSILNLLDEANTGSDFKLYRQHDGGWVEETSLRSHYLDEQVYCLSTLHPNQTKNRLFLKFSFDRLFDAFRIAEAGVDPDRTLESHQPKAVSQSGVKKNTSLNKGVIPPSGPAKLTIANPFSVNKGIYRLAELVEIYFQSREKDLSDKIKNLLSTVDIIVVPQGSIFDLQVRRRADLKDSIPFSLQTRTPSGNLCEVPTPTLDNPDGLNQAYVGTSNFPVYLIIKRDGERDLEIQFSVQANPRRP